VATGAAGMPDQLTIRELLKTTPIFVSMGRLAGSSRRSLFACLRFRFVAALLSRDVLPTSGSHRPLDRVSDNSPARYVLSVQVRQT